MATLPVPALTLSQHLKTLIHPSTIDISRITQQLEWKTVESCFSTIIACPWVANIPAQIDSSMQILRCLLIMIDDAWWVTCSLFVLMSWKAVISSAKNQLKTCERLGHKRIDEPGELLSQFAYSPKQFSRRWQPDIKAISWYKDLFNVPLMPINDKSLFWILSVCGWDTHRW